VKLWRKGLAEYDELEGIAWAWQSIDGAMVKAPLALETVGPNPTDRGKKGTKRSPLVDANGIPLPLVVSGTQRHDVALLEPTVDRIVVERPTPGPGAPQRLCGDKGYTGQPADEAVRARAYVPHIPQRGADVRATRPRPACPSPAVGRRADALLAEPVPEAPGPVREDDRRLRGVAGVSMGSPG
jgi:putative transposase